VNLPGEVNDGYLFRVAGVNASYTKKPLRNR